ncbi:hypothetical protein D3C80_1890650 [compost metagenome]
MVVTRKDGRDLIFGNHFPETLYLLPIPHHAVRLVHVDDDRVALSPGNLQIFLQPVERTGDFECRRVQRTRDADTVGRLIIELYHMNLAYIFRVSETTRIQPV